MCGLIMNIETQDQIALVAWVKMRYPKVLFTSTPAGIRLPMHRAILAKRMGYRKGCPDLVFFEPRQGFHGLTIELKKTKIAGSRAGVVSPEQCLWQAMLTEREYRAEVCHGFHNAVTVVNDYFREDNKMTGGDIQWKNS